MPLTTSFCRLVARVAPGLAATALSLALGSTLWLGGATGPLVAQAQAAAAKKPAAKRSTQAQPQRKARASSRKAVRKARVRKPVPSVGQLTGLHATDDPLDLRSSVALVVDQNTDEVLFSKNPEAVLPIASITKLMTALVVTEAGLSLEEEIVMSQADVSGTAGSRMRSALRPGTRLSRGELLHLSLMASENRAAHALGRTYPGGLGAFVRAMNRKAVELGMGDTRYVEPTGLSSDNRSSASDLARLVRAASEHPVIGELSTSLNAVLPVGKKAQPVQFNNTNGLVRNPEWTIGLQKTGFISAAGRCVVMQAELAGRQLIMVLLDSAGRYSRIGDAERLRQWIASTTLLPSFGKKALTPMSAPAPLVLPTAPLAVPSLDAVEPTLDPAKPFVHVPALALPPLPVQPLPAAGALAAQPR